jgi:hypothetical protein
MGKKLYMEVFLGHHPTNVGNPGCHKQLPFGDGWNPSHKNGDDLGMIYYWVYHILGKTNRWGID